MSSPRSQEAHPPASRHRIPPTPPRRPIARPPTHPGELMRATIKETLRLPIAAAARRMGISRRTLHDTLRGRFKLTNP